MVADAINLTFDPFSKEALHFVRVRTIRALASFTSSALIALPLRYSTLAKGSNKPLIKGIFSSITILIVSIAFEFELNHFATNLIHPS